jgi:hypothetical protein
MYIKLRDDILNTLDEDIGHALPEYTTYVLFHIK